MFLFFVASHRIDGVEHGFSQQVKIVFADSPERRRQSVDTEVVTGNTATISRTESRRCVGVDRDLTQQKKNTLSAPPVHDLFAATQGPAAPPAAPPPPPVAPAPFQMPAEPAVAPAPAPAAPAPTTIPGAKYYDREVYMAGKWCPPLAQNQQHAEPRPGERVVLWCLYDPDANEPSPVLIPASSHSLLVL